MATPVDPIRVLPFNAPGGSAIPPHYFDGIVTDKVSTAPVTAMYAIKNKSNTLVFHVYPTKEVGDETYKSFTASYKNTIVLTAGDTTSDGFDSYTEFVADPKFSFLIVSTSYPSGTHNITTVFNADDTLTIGPLKKAGMGDTTVTGWIWDYILGNTGAIPPLSAPGGRYVALLGEDTIADNFIQAGVAVGVGDDHLGANPVTYLRGNDALVPTVPVSFGVLLVQNNLGIVKSPMSLFEVKTVDPTDLDAMRAAYQGAADSYEANVEDDTEPLAKIDSKLSPVQAVLVTLITPYFG